MDLVELELEYDKHTPDKRIYMFLGFCYGIVADLDINSEFMRSIGESRYTIYGAYRIINTVNYPATFTYNGCSINSRNDNKTKDDFISG